MPQRKSAASRAARVAAMSAGVTGDYLRFLASSVFMAPDARAEARKATNRAAARRVSDEMMQLKGPLMKLGQMMSLQGDLLPAEALQELSRLQMSAPAMHGALVRAQIRASLGDDPEKLFARFDPTPFAAASLGQVHHATLQRGFDVAVKVQYPGIREAIDGDVKWFRAAMLPARLSRLMPDALLDELKEQLLAETNYAREVASMELFARELRAFEFVDIPKPFPERCGDKVITMSLLTGQHLEALLAAKPSQATRNLIGERLVFLYFYQTLAMGVLHSDPHWGNYLFRPDATIGLVDFGSVKHLSPAFVDNLRRVFLYPGRRDAPEFVGLMEERYTAAGVKLTKSSRAALSRMSEEFYGTVYPVGESASRVTDFADASIITRYMENSTRLMQAKASLPEYLMLARAELGLYQTLHRLRARVRMTEIVQRCLDATPTRGGSVG